MREKKVFQMVCGSADSGQLRSSQQQYLHQQPQEEELLLPYLQDRPIMC